MLRSKYSDPGIFGNFISWMQRTKIIPQLCTSLHISPKIISSPAVTSFSISTAFTAWGHCHCQAYSFYPGLALITQQHAYILAGLTQILLDCFDKFSSQWARSLKLLQKQFLQLLSHRVAVCYISSYPEIHGTYFCWLKVSAHFSTNCPLPSL